MGSTIRRQPLSFKIPASPDYQFLNVLNFNGLNMTDNPFTADVTTASDCLNVYVDEANALTTRPRLELFYDLHKQHPGMTKLLGVYPLSIGYLFHYIENGSYALDIAYEVSNTLTFVNVDTLTHGVNPKVDKLSVFEQNDKIYILSGEGYYFITYTIMDDVIIRAEIDNVEGYIPTTRVGKSNNQEGSVFDDLNVLSDKYKESYFWDGTWDINKNITNVESIENNYITQRIIEDDYVFLKYLPGKKCFLVKTSDMKIGFYTPGENDENPVFEEISQPTDLPQHNDIWVDVNSDGSCVVVVYCGSVSDSDVGVNYIGGLYVYRDGVWKRVVYDLNNPFSSQIGSISGMVTHYGVKLSEDSSKIITVSYNNVLYISYDSDAETYSIKESDYKKIITTGINLIGRSGLIVSDDCSCFLLGLLYNTGGYFITYKNLSPDMSDFKHTSTIKRNQGIMTAATISKDGNSLFLIDHQSNKPIRHYSNFKTSDDFEYLPLKREVFSITDNKELRIILSENNEKIYFWTKNNKSGWILNNQTYDVIFNDGLTDGVDKLGPDSYTYATNNAFYYLSNKYVKMTDFDYLNNEPVLIVTRKIDSSHDYFSQWSENNKSFFKSFLTTRFNNERWFAGGNRLYYTTYNNPTYISLYNYNDLGESDENITGFTLADDSTLIVYKDNRVHSVKYGEVGENVYTYVYSDSPNTVGNNAFGGSIVSILTEMPLQISYDGIYALRQLTNVQSSGRISELISEGINKKWLKESKEIIKNCKTINRLYWTYFILSEKDYSKIYLLDNRTQSWYYWELPISILNAFVKNNTTYFSDTEGNLYTLKTTDLFNKFNPEITEYYDEGKKLIKWNWKSQILPMKTINYSKKLVSTTFIMSDTDEKDEYGLNYKFKAFRKTASQTQETTLTNNINYIVSTTKRTLVPRFNFMQIELSNVEGTSDDFDHNKLRLIGLAFKYVLLEGLV